MGGALKRIGQIGLGIGSVAAAPFTAGGSLAFLPAILGGGSTALGLLNRGGGSGGNSNDARDMLAGITQEQAGLFSELVKQYMAERDLRDKLNQPAIDFYSAIAGGDRTKAMQANAPIFTAIAEQTQQARNRVMNEVPRGVGQQFALSQLPIQSADAAARAIYEPYIGSFDKLAGMGNQYGQSSLQTLGGGLRAGEGATQNILQLLEMEAKKRGSTLGFLGDLIGSIVPRVLGKALNSSGGGAGRTTTVGKTFGPNLGDLGATGGF